MIIAKIFTIVVSVVTLFWLITVPGFESLVAFLSAIAAIIAAFLATKHKRVKDQHQSLSRSSIGIQAGRDINIKSKDNA